MLDLILSNRIFMHGKYLRSYDFCVFGSALVIYNDIKHKCHSTIFANDNITVDTCRYTYH